MTEPLDFSMLFLANTLSLDHLQKLYAFNGEFHPILRIFYHLTSINTFFDERKNLNEEITVFKNFKLNPNYLILNHLFCIEDILDPQVRNQVVSKPVSGLICFNSRRKSLNLLKSIGLYPKNMLNDLNEFSSSFMEKKNY